MSNEYKRLVEEVEREPVDTETIPVQIGVGQAVPLVGGTIVEALQYSTGVADWERFDGFIVEFPDKRRVLVTVSQDDEGNGPGSLWLDEQPKE